MKPPEPGQHVTLRTGTTVLEGYVKAIHSGYEGGPYDPSPAFVVEVEVLPGADRPLATGGYVEPRKAKEQYADEPGWAVKPGGYTKSYRPTKEEEQQRMDEYPKATIIRRPESKTVNVYLEIEEGIYLTGGPDAAGAKRVEREIGEEMPLFMSIPEEYYLPVMRAACSDSLGRIR